MEINVSEQKDSIKLVKNSLGVGYELRVFGEEGKDLLEKVKELKNRVEEEFKDEIVQVKK